MKWRSEGPRGCRARAASTPRAACPSSDREPGREFHRILQGRPVRDALSAVVGAALGSHLSRGCSDSEPADADRHALGRAVFVVESLTDCQLVCEQAACVPEVVERISLVLSGLPLVVGVRVIALLLWTDHEPFLVDQAARSLVSRHLSTGRALFQRWV